MLSVLIPVYNYNVFPLVENLLKQCLSENIVFEIIALDDASKNEDTIKANQEINNLEKCSYQVLPENLGRSGIRNLLAKRAQYNWLLFLDADTMPVDNSLVSKYLPHLNDEEKVIYGGIIYQEKQPEKQELLRWVYGNSREALSVKKRTSDPYLSMLTLNFAIKKSVFEKVTFNETIPNLRYEDILFSYDLSRNNITMQHIANPVYHLGLDTSYICLIKAEDSIKGLKYLLDHQLLDANYMRLSKTYIILKRFYLTGLLSLLFRANKSLMQKNLLGGKPSLFVFDLYRLGYLSLLQKGGK